MKIIYKFNLNIGESIWHLPKNAKLIHVAKQLGQLQMWAECDSNDKTVERYFRVYGTSQPINDLTDVTSEYVGTALMEGGTFVAHVYEAKPRKMEHW